MSDPMKVCVEIEVQEIADAIIRQLTKDETLVEVVRCKDCKHLMTPYCDLYYSGYRKGKDWYCADGERKTE